MRKLSCFFLLISALTASPAKAQLITWSGNSWLTMCGTYSSGNKLMDLHCEAYTQGVIEGFMWGHMAGQAFIDEKVQQRRPYCLSSGQTLAQYILVIKKTMQAAPEFLDKPAPWLIHGAMSAIFPCGK